MVVLFLVLAVYLKIHFNTKYSAFSARYIWHLKFLMRNLLVTLFRIPFLLLLLSQLHDLVWVPWLTGHCLACQDIYTHVIYQTLEAFSHPLFYLLPLRLLQYICWFALQVHEFFWAISTFFSLFLSVPDNCHYPLLNIFWFHLLPAQIPLTPTLDKQLF